MRWNRVAGILVGLVSLVVSLVAAGIVIVYLSEYGERRIAAAVCAAVVGVVVSVTAYFLVSRYCTTGKSSLLVIVLLAVILLAPLVSMAYPGRIIYSRFGLTVYGVIPVPLLDITVGSHRGLWFRDKSHFVSLEEVESLLSPDVEILVIGAGWNSAVKVDSAAKEMQGIEVHILPTPEAFELFNQYRLEGRRVALIAHSTC
jgi:hypothetical protein